MGDFDRFDAFQYYLYVGNENLSPSNVFFVVENEFLANQLCKMLSEEYQGPPDVVFRYEAIRTDDYSRSIRLSESLDMLESYGEAEDLDLSTDLLIFVRLEYASRAAVWVNLIRQQQARIDRSATMQSQQAVQSRVNGADLRAFESIRRLLEKHRLMFLYFARPGRRNPLNLRSQSESLCDYRIPQVPSDEIDSEGEFLFVYRRRFEDFAQAAVSRFGTGLGIKPKTITKSGELMDVEGGSYPYWEVDETACIYLDESADRILDACRSAVRNGNGRLISEFLPQIKLATHDEGHGKWYASNLVRWSYLMKLDELLHALKHADLDIVEGTPGSNEPHSTSIEPASQGDESHGKQPSHAQMQLLGQSGVKKPVQQSGVAASDAAIAILCAGAKWQDLSMRLVDGETISVKVGDRSQMLGYFEMGFTDGRNKKPNKQWELLINFALNRGLMTWESLGANRKNKKQKAILSRKLKEVFCIEGDPILLTDDKKGWQTSFGISPES